MQLYGIFRRNGWATLADLEVAGKKSAEVGDTEGSGVRWIRSYALSEESGEIGTFCVYEGESPEAIRKHAENSDLPCDEVVEIATTVVVRPDPVPAAG
jgi:sporulation protein YlmC with PRC-barrel domain